MRLIIILWLAALVVIACDDPTGERFLSPLPPGIDLRLVTNVWEIVEVVHQGEPVPFDGVPHFRVYFQWKGRLGYLSGCHGGGFRIDFESQHRYRLHRVVSPGITCTSPRDEEQYMALVRALEATQEYSFHDGQLWLTGDETRFVLEVAEAFPAFPAAESSVMLNRWRWVEVRDSEGIVNIDALSPINTVFTVDGVIWVEAKGHLDSYYRIAMSESGGYVLTHIGLTEYTEGMAAQAQRALDALLATTHYELRENRLILSGEDVQVVLEIAGPFLN